MSKTRFVVVGISVGLVGLVAACGDDSSSGTTATDGGGASSTSSGGSSSGGSSGTSSSGGSSGGSSSGDSGTDSGSSPSTPCTALPVTVALGDGIDPTRKSAILCFNETTLACHLTTNTYSCGPAACPPGDSMIFFTERTDNQQKFVSLNNGWVYESASAGTFNTNTLSNPPVSTSITAVAEKGLDAGGPKKKFVFTFNGSYGLTLTSFGDP